MASIITVVSIVFLFFALSNASANQVCEDIFADSKNILAENEGIEGTDEYSKNIVKLTQSIIAGSEIYINSCISLRPNSISKNKAIFGITKLLQLGCSKRRSNIQFLITEGKSNSVFILHTELNSCASESVYDGGFSAIFVFDNTSGLWKGYPLWPSDLFKNKTQEGWEFYYAQYFPKIYFLPFVDSKGSKYIAIESTFEGGDHSSNQLSVIRWLNNSFKEVLSLQLSDWCGQPNRWQYIQGGKFIVPEANATERCEKRNRTVYSITEL